MRKVRAAVVELARKRRPPPRRRRQPGSPPCRIGDVARTPVTVIRPLSEPRRPILIESPTRAVALGSPTMAKSDVALRRRPFEDAVRAVDAVGLFVIGNGPGSRP